MSFVYLLFIGMFIALAIVRTLRGGVAPSPHRDPHPIKGRMVLDTRTPVSIPKIK